MIDNEEAKKNPIAENSVYHKLTVIISSVQQGKCLLFECIDFIFRFKNAINGDSL